MTAIWYILADHPLTRTAYCVVAGRVGPGAARPRFLLQPDSPPALPGTAPPDGGDTAALPEASDTPTDSQADADPLGT